MHLVVAAGWLCIQAGWARLALCIVRADFAGTCSLNVHGLGICTPR